MSVQGMNHFTVLSDDLEVTKNFYCDLLGLEPGPRPNFQFPGWWLYAGDHPVLHVSVRHVASTKGGTGSFDHIALRATGLTEMRALLERRGIPFEEQRVDDNTVHQIFFHDPNGLRVELDYELSDAEAADAALMPAR